MTNENMCVKTRGRPSQKQIVQVETGVVGKGKRARVGTGRVVRASGKGRQ